MQPRPDTSSYLPPTSDVGWEAVASQTPSPSDALDRVGEILFRAACRSHLDVPSAQAETTSKLSSNEVCILAAISELGSAAPAELLSRVDVSRATLARELQALRSQHLVDRSGLTRQARYSLTAAGDKKLMSQQLKSCQKPDRVESVPRITKSQTADAA